MTKENSNLPGNIKSGSLRAKTFELLSDGKLRTAEDICKEVKGSLGARAARVFLGPILKDLEKAGIKIAKKDGQIQISPARAKKAKKAQ